MTPEEEKATIADLKMSYDEKAGPWVMYWFKKLFTLTFFQWATQYLRYTLHWFAFYYIYRSEAEKLEIKALKQITSCSQTFGNTGLETTAYLRALAEAKGLNVDKHRVQVAKEMKKQEADEEGTILILQKS